MKINSLSALLVIGASILLSGCAQTAKTATTSFSTPIKMIIETDMGNDIDDALALAAALRAVNEGKIDLLAVGCHKKSHTAAPYVDAVCTYYGHPEVQAAMSLTPVLEKYNGNDYTATEKDFAKTYKTYPDPVKLYRKLLSEAKDGSIVFVSLGFGTTIAQLLESAPDEYSKLNGVELVAKKTKGLSIMAGSYGANKINEYNVTNDIPAMKKVFALWPTIIWQNPFEIGKQVVFSGKLVENNLGYEGAQPVSEAYVAFQKMPYNRPSWDILSVIYPVYPELFTISEPGFVTVDDKGATMFEAKKGGKHFVLSATIDQPQALKACEEKMILK